MSRLCIGVKAVEELYIHKIFLIIVRVHARLCHLHSLPFFRSITRYRSDRKAAHVTAC